MPYRAVVALDIGILLRLAWLDMGDGDVSLLGPRQKRAADIFRAVIDANYIRLATPLDDPVEGSTDPLGRPMRHNEFTDDYTVKIPGEIDVQRVRRILEELRRRLADPSRPQIELDYIERLLKDY